MHNYLTKYYIPTYFDNIMSSSGSLKSITLPSYTSISNAAVGNTIYNQDVSHMFYAGSRIIVVVISVL